MDKTIEYLKDFSKEEIERMKKNCEENLHNDLIKDFHKGVDWDYLLSR